MKNYLLAGGLVSTLALLAMAGAASAETTSGPTLSGGVTFASDYRLRGASVSDNQPVIQGSLELDVPVTTGFKVFAGIWGSSLDTQAGAGANETDLYAGVGGKLGVADWKASYLRIDFQDANTLSFNQYAASIGAPVGPFNLGLGVVHDDYKVGDSTYEYGTAAYTLPHIPLTIKALIGHEDGINWDNKQNWELGAFYTYKKVTFGANYVDTNKTSLNSKGKNRAGGAVILSASAGF
ncbi:TorF family putative porin [Asticcacaulis sp. EMRT-3]|uniref:TorF family putative porin n=1 Tax=Asticcacaulis sp. EMRT-3 TaxID=3040349 RepID=UPI0024AF9CA7|nr:TorF family putative porin [Asticcacaulis sp. EMRT-3]MDI7775656.1 TorF family putative porin [Asticcacaulis sp. EMRT-3]